jgi:hypothetical protein
MLLSVNLNDGEEIDWIWTHPQDGPGYVSGYRIVPKLPQLASIPNLLVARADYGRVP